MQQFFNLHDHFSDMKNISMLTDFPHNAPLGNYTEVASAFAGKYTVYTGGHFVFVSNSRNRTVRFTNVMLQPTGISSSLVEQWLEKIRMLFPQF